MQQMHVGLFQCPTSFAMVAGWAGCNQVAPFMSTSLAAWIDVVNRQLRRSFAAILASVIVSPEDLAFIKFYPDARSFDHPIQPNDGGPWIFLRHSMNKSAPIEDQRGFTGHH